MPDTLHVYYAAQKLILEVPRGDGVASFPAGAIISPKGQNNLRPAVVVEDATDAGGTWQGADDKIGVIIVDDVTREMADLILQILGRDFSMGMLKCALTHLQCEGYNKQRTITKEFVKRHFVPVKRIGPYTGVFVAEGGQQCTVYRDNLGILWLFDGTQTVHIKEHLLLKWYTAANGKRIDPDKIPIA